MKPFEKVGDDIERRHAFNTAIAAMMELSNANNKFEAKDDNDVAVARESITTLLNFTRAICTAFKPDFIG